MKTTISVFTILLIKILLSSSVNGQGCSDAGFCTMNSFKPNSNDSLMASSSKQANQIKIGVSYGQADYSIIAIGGYIEYNRIIGEKIGIDTKLTTLSQNGNGISTFGVSDLFLNMNYEPIKKFKLSVGGKIPLMDGNRTENNLSLPMDYQSSLGTFDLLLGVGYEIFKIQFVAALQQPLTQNKNGFTPEDYDVMSTLSGWQSTNNYKRSGDVLFRVSYPIKLGNRFLVSASMLSIYHLANDMYTDTFGVEREIAGSQGLTLNGNAYVDFKVSNSSALQFNVGTPFIVRKSRPDGLTRSLILSLEYRFKF